MKNSGEFYKALMLSGLFLLLGFTSPLEAKTKTTSSEPTTFKARITFYYPNEAKSGFTSAKGDRLVPWKSAAVCFRTIPYGSKIKIPGIGTLVAQDTGSAVISRKAARQNGANVPVIDVCVPNRAEMVRMGNEFPKFVEVEVKKSSQS